MKYQSFLVLSLTSAMQLGCESEVEPVVTDHPRLEASGEFLSLSGGALSFVDPRLRLRLIATVKPPTIGTDTLQATDLHLVNKTAFISYNVAGATQKGGIDVVDITKITNPKMISSIELPNHDANAIYRHKKNIYVVGAVDSGGAAMLRVPFSSNILDEVYTTYALSSYAGTDVSVRSNRVYVTSGDTGGLQIFNLESMALESSLDLADARGISTSSGDDYLRVVLGQPGAVALTSSEAELKTTYALGGNSAAESKSTIESGKTTTAVSLGDKGFKIICNQNGAELAHIEAVSVAGIEASETVTNAVSYDDGMLYAANGEAGVYVYNVKEGDKVDGTNCRSLKVSLAGALRFESDISANHIVFKKGYLFVASGLGGFKIIQVDRPRSSDDFDDFDDDDDRDDRD